MLPIAETLARHLLDRSKTFSDGRIERLGPAGFKVSVTYRDSQHKAGWNRESQDLAQLR
jgi:hypothetical protein